MLLRTHLVFAVFLYVIFFSYLGFVNRFLFLIFLLIATAFVDIDSSKSRIGKKWYFRPLQWFVSHRGMFHSLFFGLILSLIIYYFSKDAGFGFLMGYYFHLFLDCFTRSGVRLLWPFSDFNFKIIRIKSGGLIEEILFVLVFLADIGLIIRLFLIGYF